MEQRDNLIWEAYELLLPMARQLYSWKSEEELPKYKTFKKEIHKRNPMSKEMSRLERKIAYQTTYHYLKEEFSGRWFNGVIDSEVPYVPVLIERLYE